MRYIKFFTIALLLCLFVGCDGDLPYPLESVKNGVVIDVVRVDGSDGVISAGTTEGNYQLAVSVPTQQGDYSFLDYAQLACVFTDAEGKTTSVRFGDKLKSFPVVVDVDLADVYSALGLISPELGQVVCFTADVVLKGGFEIPGWSEYYGYNNSSSFSGWQVDGRGYSYRVRYPVACQLDLEEFEGEFFIEDGFFEEEYSVVVTKVSDTELKVSGFGEFPSPDGEFMIKVDPATHTVSVPKAVLYPSIWGYTNLSIGAGSGEIDACKGSISFTAPMTVDQGSFGSCKFVLKR